MFFLSPLTPDILFVALLRYLVLFRLCFCCWQGSKIKPFPLQRAKGLGVPLEYDFPNCLRVLLGRKRVDGITHLLYPVTEAFISKELGLSFTFWAVFSTEKQLRKKGAGMPWIIPGTQAKCGRKEMVLSRTSLYLIVFILHQGNLS